VDEPTFAGMGGNEKDAPITAIPTVEIGQGLRSW
jgi:hypothetical protein